MRDKLGSISRTNLNARLFFSAYTVCVITKYNTAQFVERVQNTQICSGSNDRGFNARPRDLTGRASLFIYLFIYSFFFSASLHRCNDAACKIERAIIRALCAKL